MYDKTWDDDLRAKGTSQIAQVLRSEDYEQVQVLLDDGVTFDPEHEPTLLTECVQKGLPDACDMLIQNGYDVNARDANGKIALHSVRDVEVAEVLLKHGAEVNAQDLDGNTPLHREFGIGLDVAMFLMTNGADAFITNHFGQSPVDVAERYGEWNQQENASVIDAMKAFGEKAVIKRALDQPTPSQIYRDTNEEERRQDASHQDQAFASYEHRNERKRVFRM